MSNAHDDYPEIPGASAARVSNYEALLILSRDMSPTMREYCAALLAEHREMRDALRELVACKELQDRVGAPSDLIEYQRRKPIAWEAARAAIDKVDGPAMEDQPKPPPYPQFCRHPDKCAGKSYCPREIACCD